MRTIPAAPRTSSLGNHFLFSLFALDASYSGAAARTPEDRAADIGHEAAENAPRKRATYDLPFRAFTGW